MQTNDIIPKVLYVDDEEDNLLVFKSSFRRNYDVLTATSADEAIQLLKDNPVDVIVSDQRMPKINGVDFLRSLPDEPYNMRMILTGYSDIEAVIDALNAGKIHKYIKKPWDKDELRQIIDESIEKLVEFRNGRLLGNTVSKVTDDSASGKAKNTAESTIQSKDEEIKKLQQQIFESNKNVQLLGEIGQEITSSLNLDEILNTVYESVNELMDAYSFGIGIYNSEHNTIDYRLAIENAVRYKPYSRSMEDKNQFPVWCIENKKEIFINDVEQDYGKYITHIDELKEVTATLEDGTQIVQFPHSLIYMPLMVKNKLIGLITVQSLNKNAYNDHHLNTLRNIGIFVATALENAKAYKLIEEQKAEIEHKNVELEHKVSQRTDELRQQKEELEDTFSKLKLLTEIGQEITSTLNLDVILNTIYENVNSLMDASVFGIGIYHEESETIDYRLAIENGKRYQPYTRTMEDKNQFPVWCIENKKEVFINDISKDSKKYLPGDVKINLDEIPLEDGTKADIPLSLIYLPLLFNNKPIGVLTVQSFRKYSYNQYHLDILRSLASYITTAIQNAHSYQKMTEAFEQLKTAQSKLVESEKMASLGVLTAGVAHEINNPVNFISGGISSLKDNYEDIKKLLMLVNDFNLDKNTDEQWKHIEENKKKLGLVGLMQEMEQLIGSIQNGATRTAEIVKGLRNFSRLDESDMKTAGMEEGIDNTLVILNNRIKDRVEIIKEYADIPKIMCYPGQLNQVFMNILYNAADAIVGEGKIYIKTWQQGDDIKISFRDTGTGMPEHVRAHIFEPFFTTKAVGKGTGLGLSISYGIIEKHKGTIEVKSEVGKGTEFILTLPVS